MYMLTRGTARQVNMGYVAWVMMASTAVMSILVSAELSFYTRPVSLALISAINRNQLAVFLLVCLHLRRPNWCVGSSY